MLRAIPIINLINVSQTCVSRYPASDCWYNMIGNLFFRQPATSHKHPPIKLTHLSDEGLAQGGGDWRTSSPPLLLLPIEWLLTRSFAVHIIHRWGRSVGGWLMITSLLFYYLLVGQRRGVQNILENWFHISVWLYYQREENGKIRWNFIYHLHYAAWVAKQEYNIQ